MANCEYKVLNVDTKGISGPKEKNIKESDLNNLGKDGWELVSAIPLNAVDGSTTWVSFVFTRSTE